MRNVTRIGIIKKLIVFIFFNHKTKKNDKKSTFLIQVIKIRPVLKNGKKRAKKLKKRWVKMWQFILGLFIGANISLILYAIILAGKRDDTYNEWK